MIASRFDPEPAANLNHTMTSPAKSILFDINASRCIREIFLAVGGRYTNGAQRLCDGPRDTIFYRFLEVERADGCVEASRPSSCTDGLMDFTVGVEFVVRGPDGADWRMVVAREPNRTLTAWKVVLSNGRYSELGCRRGLASVGLIDQLVDMYLGEPA